MFSAGRSTRVGRDVSLRWLSPVVLLLLIAACDIAPHHPVCVSADTTIAPPPLTCATPGSWYGIALFTLQSNTAIRDTSFRSLMLPAISDALIVADLIVTEYCGVPENPDGTPVAWWANTSCATATTTSVGSTTTMPWTTSTTSSGAMNATTSSPPPVPPPSSNFTLVRFAFVPGSAAEASVNLSSLIVLPKVIGLYQGDGGDTPAFQVTACPKVNATTTLAPNGGSSQPGGLSTIDTVLICAGVFIVAVVAAVGAAIYFVGKRKRSEMLAARETAEAQRADRREERRERRRNNRAAEDLDAAADRQEQEDIARAIALSRLTSPAADAVISPMPPQPGANTRNTSAFAPPPPAAQQQLAPVPYHTTAPVAQTVQGEHHDVLHPEGIVVGVVVAA